jgi:hypothetical protein
MNTRVGVGGRGYNTGTPKQIFKNLVNKNAIKLKIRDPPTLFGKP